MSTYDKHDVQGYDAQDRELNDALEALHRQSPKVARLVQQRVHEGILQRLKELGTKKCYVLLEDLEKCMNGQGPMLDFGLKRCRPQRDAVNECYREVHTEENYQRFRLQMLRGELLQEHAQKTIRKIEAYKSQSPETIAGWKPDYAWRYKNLADRLNAPSEFNTEFNNNESSHADFAAPGINPSNNNPLPSTVEAGQQVEPRSAQDALGLLSQQNAVTQEFRKRRSTYFSPQPPETDARFAVPPAGGGAAAGEE